eukprot:m.12001 g.12001  ORF g.12001 m.12001 type:complete len:109 (+) comp23759_c0_seq1:564-890(+)
MCYTSMMAAMLSACAAGSHYKLLEEFTNLSVVPFEMVAGYGVNGGRGRCFPFWQDMLSCLHNRGGAEGRTICQLEREDYLECLHHKKLSQRIIAIQKEKERVMKKTKA